MAEKTPRGSEIIGVAHIEGKTVSPQQLIAESTWDLMRKAPQVVIVLAEDPTHDHDEEAIPFGKFS